MSVEEKSLKALDGILDSAQQQINALKGIDLSVYSLTEAIRGFDVALGSAKADPVASSGGAIAGMYKELLGRPADAAGLKWYQDRVAEGVSLSEIRKAILGSNERADYLKQIKGIPGYASGGMFSEGLRIMGENGPELEATGPARIFSADQTRNLMTNLRNPSNGNDALIVEIKALREEVAALRKANSEENYAIAKHAAQTSDTLDRTTMGGGPMLVTFEGVPQLVRVVAS